MLGTHYSAKMKATFLDEQQKEKPIVMGCYGIGVSRLAAAAIEQNHDADGIVWPMPIAPYHAIITALGKDDAVKQAAETLYQELLARGVETILDDRDERPGVKFKDADLLGIPLRVTVGGKGLAEGVIELKPRRQKDAKKVPLAAAADAVRDAVVEAGGRLGR